MCAVTWLAVNYKTLIMHNPLHAVSSLDAVGAEKPSTMYGDTGVKSRWEKFFKGNFKEYLLEEK